MYLTHFYSLCQESDGSEIFSSSVRDTKSVFNKSAASEFMYHQSEGCDFREKLTVSSEGLQILREELYLLGSSSLVLVCDSVHRLLWRPASCSYLKQPEQLDWFLESSCGETVSGTTDFRMSFSVAMMCLTRQFEASAMLRLS